MPVSLAQQEVVQAQAKADAKADMSDRSAMWFLLGVMGSTAGCLLGCAGGCLLGARLNPFGGTSIFPSPSEAGCGAGVALLLGALAVPIGVHTYPHNAMPPPERLLGKSPEYIEAYTQIYKSETASLRKTLATKGSIAGNVAFALAMLLLFANAF